MGMLIIVCAEGRLLAFLLSCLATTWSPMLTLVLADAKSQTLTPVLASCQTGKSKERGACSGCRCNVYPRCEVIGR